MRDGKRYRDLNEFLFVNRETVNKTQLAKRLNVWPSKLTALLNPHSYRVNLDEVLEARIASVLNQSVEYVRKLYAEAA